MEINLFGDIIPEEVIEEVKVEKTSPFVYNNYISNKKYPTDDTFKDYNPFLTNIGFSQRNDTVFYANELNKYHSLGNKEQFDFYYHSLPKKKYFAKWAKAPKESSLEYVCEYFNVSKRVAKEYIHTLTDTQLKEIKKFVTNSKGGKK